MLPAVVVISTGGTIATRFNPEKGGAVPAVSGRNLVEAVPALNGLCSLEVVEFANIPSFHITPAIMARLALEVEKALARPDVAGAVVTHGTDTLEETAYFLELYLTPEKTVCLTGAMRSSDDLSPDGPANIYCAALAAVSSQTRGHGVLVAMNSELHAAARVTKTHKNALQTFASPSSGPVGHVYKNCVSMCWPPLSRRRNLRPDGPLKRVPILKMYTGMDSALFDALLAMGMDGLVIEGYGLGNVPEAAIPGIERVLRRGIPVVTASRVPAGRTLAVYAPEGGAEHLRSMGVLLSGDLNSQKARIKLMLALGLTSDPDALAEYFAVAE